jgi:N-acetylglucosaminyl-diphospho-decaprenol L-rhamnosyltransferase
MTDLGIVIVNWNTRDLLRQCLRSVFASEGVSLRVVVVDNASHDGSAAMVRTEFPQADLIASAENNGFPKANNMGLRLLGFVAAGDVAADAPRYALLLNPDTELPPAGLAQMTRFMDERPDVGIAGPQLVLPDGSLDLACRRGFPSPAVSFYHYSGLARLFPASRRFGRYNMTFADREEDLEVDAIVGAFMQVRREVIHAIGLMDERFFMYAEDIDWAYRAKAEGWRVWYHAPVRVMHVKRAASRQSTRARLEFYRAMLLFYRKHYRDRTWWPVHILVLLGLLIKGGPALWPEIRHPSPLATTA